MQFPASREAKEERTSDLCIANVALNQLSHGAAGRVCLNAAMPH